MSDLETGVNIGRVLAGELRRAGISTLAELRRLGHAEAWRRIHAVAPDRDCVHTCLALAGAIRNRRWTSIPKDERATLVAEAKSLA